MIRFPCRLAVLSVAAVLAGPVAQAATEGASARMFGGGRAVALRDLPAEGLRDGLERLPEPAQQRALGWLQRFEFPGEDVRSLRADADGGVFYACEFPAAPAGAVAAAETPGVAAAAVPVAPFPAALKFHSRPGATNVIFVDFDGHSVSGTAWNTDLGRDPIPAVAFSLDSDYTTYSDTEQIAIKRIWQRMAEDYAPFDVDVTTEEPAVFGTRTARALITRNSDADGLATPASTAGGVAYVNVFGSSSFAYYSPAWIYVNNLGYSDANCAEAASHEIGHNLGLSHDGLTSGSEYYGGHGSDAISWGPLMGTGYGRNVSQWCKGEYYLANNTQDDLATIAGKLKYRNDDIGATVAAAALLTFTNFTEVRATNPETDPAGASTANKGVIERNGDADLWAFSSGTGTVSLTVQPWVSPSGTRGGNLDLLVQLEDAAGTVLATNNPPNDTPASVTASVTPGMYYLRIQAVGAGDPTNSVPTGYTAYGSLGQYFITGQVTAAGGYIVPPQASLGATNVTDAGATGHTIRVTYSDNVAVQASSIGADDLRVTGPGGYDQPALFASVDAVTNGKTRVGTYVVPAPGGTWDRADNGIYAVWMTSNAVSDTEGAYVPDGMLGSFTCNVPQVIYSADMSSDPGWTLAGQWAYGVPTGVLGDPTSGATGPNVIGYNLEGQYAKNLSTVYATTPAISCAGADTVLLRFQRRLGLRSSDTASIQVSTNGTTWSTVWSSTSTISDTVWKVVQYDLTATAARRPAVYLRWGMRSNTDSKISFGWNIDDVQLLGTGAGLDADPPSASLYAPDVTREGGVLYEFAVTFTDATAVAVASFDSEDIVVTGPGALSVTSSLAGVDDTLDGTPRTATYQFTPPGGAWDASDNGTYTVTLLPDAVQDTLGNEAAGGTLGTFVVNIATNAPTTGAVACDLTPAGAVDAGAAWNLTSGSETGPQADGAVVGDLPPGTYEVAFAPLAGWQTPATQTVAVAAGSTSHVSAVYARLWTLAASADDPARGSVTPADGRYADGEVVQVTAVASNYFAFSGWSGDATGTNNPVGVAMTTNRTVVASFAELLTTNHPTPLWWLAAQGVTEDFETAVDAVGANGSALWESWVAGLDPQDPESVLRVDFETQDTADGLVLGWCAVSGRVYSVWRSAEPGGAGAVVTGAEALSWPCSRFTDTTYRAQSPSFYRIGVSRP